jgi:hypothetical protein
MVEHTPLVGLDISCHESEHSPFEIEQVDWYSKLLRMGLRRFLLYRMEPHNVHKYNSGAWSL